ncbi:hypothetical protein CRG98_012091 [Punica granatum]|uniref:Reverse transcriptase/retrotransposon-derived protein RNase H-like domain-containing protein n=1 Tax=Punica granatum TaxID=22663 RepID=A0A2I0KG83_PUNGR|nr:hypothetical protein CRG98_012091 [Punica granatum]
MELPPSLTVREVRSFLGWLNYIARFIANMTDKCQPLFCLLLKNATVEWDDECQKTFDTVKAYLIQPQVLVLPSPDRPLILYLTVRRQTLGFMLGQKDDSTHAKRTIYYSSKKFTERESNYPEIEKMCCALVRWKTKDPKLVPYHEYLEELMENFEKVSFTYTPRMKNQFADTLATLASLTSNTFCKPANSLHLLIIMIGGLFGALKQTSSSVARLSTAVHSMPYYYGVSTKMRHNGSWKKCTKGIADLT